MRSSTSLRGLVLLMTLLGLAEQPAAAHPGIGIVADSRGNVFYTDLHRVLMIDPAGRVSVAVPDVHTHELYLDQQDNLFGEHLWYEGDATRQWGHRVWKRAPDGRLTDVVPATRGFRKAFEFVRDAAGNEYWVGDSTGNAEQTRTTLFVRSPSGQRRTVAGGFVNARWISADASGVVYVVDDRRIKRVDPDGRVVAITPRLRSGLFGDFIGGVTADGRGTVYVANWGAGRVDRIAADGAIGVFARSGVRFGPTGICLHGDEVWVLESAMPDGVRVKRFGADGRLKQTYRR